MSDNPVFLCADEYDTVDDAKADLEELKELHREKLVGTYDAAVLTKNEEGKIEIVDKIEAKPARRPGRFSGRCDTWSHLPAFCAGQRAGGVWRGLSTPCSPRGWWAAALRCGPLQAQQSDPVAACAAPGKVMG